MVCGSYKHLHSIKSKLGVRRFDVFLDDARGFTKVWLDSRPPDYAPYPALSLSCLNIETYEANGILSTRTSYL
jgi:hypothetical protein